jgi:hypothetical protein
MRTMKIVGLGLWLALSMACKDDDDVSQCDLLEGTWQMESWKEDGEEVFGDTIFITTSEMIFHPRDSSGRGNLNWDITYLIGGTENIIGSYQTNESCDEVTLVPKDGVPSTYNFSISGEELTLSAEINSAEIVMLLRKE